MSLNEMVLRKIAEWRPTGSDRQTFTFRDEAAGWTTTIAAARNDELGSLVWEVSLRRINSTPAELTLQAWADRCAARITGLLEQLKVVEVDPTRDEAMLRSVKPTERGESIYYFQLMLKGTNEATLSRYQASHQTNKPREQVSFPITHETLAKVVGDIV